MALGTLFDFQHLFTRIFSCLFEAEDLGPDCNQLFCKQKINLLENVLVLAGRI